MDLIADLSEAITIIIGMLFFEVVWGEKRGAENVYVS